MEKLICSACGAPLTVNTNEPFLKCEYCDTAIENKYYVAPEVKDSEPVQETAETVETEDAETSDGGSLLHTLLGVGTAIAANKLRRRSVTARPPMDRRTPPGRSASTPHPRTMQTAPRRHPEPPRTGSMGARPARGGRPSGGPGGHGGPGGRGPGGMGGPGGRHR